MAEGRGFDPIAYINEPRWRRSSLGLSRITLLLEKLGNPQRSFACVHVAGTNGKGSTCAYLASILRAAGLRTGLFTSPYVERFEERIQVDGAMIGPDALREAALQAKEAASEVEAERGEHPTEFELMAAVGFLHFARARCDVAVVECGLGGRLDATNVVDPVLAVVTPIGLDHTDVLGDTLAAIAGEKAGIVKPGVPVVSAPQKPEAAEVLEERCRDAGSPLSFSEFSQLAVEALFEEGDGSWPRSARPSPAPPGGRPVVLRRFSYRGTRYETRMLAAYQPRNAAVAIDAARVLARCRPGFGISQEAICEGVAAATWPGRFEVVSTGPLVVVDGAHNPDGALAFAGSMRELLGEGGRKAALVVGVLADKDREGILAPLLPMAGRVVAYAPDNPRALPAEELARLVGRMAAEAGLSVEVETAPDAAAAMARALHEEGPEGIVAAVGSLYSVGALKHAVM